MTYLILLPLVFIMVACATGGEESLSSAGSYSASSRSDVPPTLPTLEDAQLSNMLQRLAPEYFRWLASPSGYLIVPTKAPPWPCEVSESDKQTLAGVPVKLDQKLIASIQAKVERSVGYKKGALKRETLIKNPQVYLVKGVCADGKLTGELETIAEYVSVETGGLLPETGTPTKVFSRFRVVAGKRVGENFSAKLLGQLQGSNPGSDIKVKTLTGIFNLANEGLYERGVTISYSRTETAKPMFGSYVDVTQNLFLKLPTSGNRWKFITYVGNTKASEVMYKGNVMHGKSISYARIFNSPYSPNPINVPASEGCYDEGELIKSVACDVN